MLENKVRPDGAKVRELRKKKKWTQEQLAESATCSKRTVENIEAGKNVTETILSDIAAALDAAFDALRLPDEESVQLIDSATASLIDPDAIGLAAKVIAGCQEMYDAIAQVLAGRSNVKANLPVEAVAKLHALLAEEEWASGYFAAYKTYETSISNFIKRCYMPSCPPALSPADAPDLFGILSEQIQPAFSELSSRYPSFIAEVACRTRRYT